MKRIKKKTVVGIVILYIVVNSGLLIAAAYQIIVMKKDYAELSEKCQKEITDKRTILNACVEKLKKCSSEEETVRSKNQPTTGIPVPTHHEIPNPHFDHPDRN